MKIISLWVSEYKNLKDIKLTFNNKLINIMVGQNGVGKSNLIEIFTLIFKDLFTLGNKGDFADDDKRSATFNYIIKYECRGHNVEISNTNSGITFHVKLAGEIDFSAMSFAEFKRQSKIILPDRIVGYYSGENKRLTTALSEYTERERAAQRRSTAKDGDYGKMRSIFFSENDHSRLIFFTLAAYSWHHRYGESINYLLDDVLKLNQFTDFEIKFKNPSFSNLSLLKKDDLTMSYFEGVTLTDGNMEKLEDKNIWGINGKVEPLLRLALWHYVDDASSYSLYEDNGKEYFSIRDSISETPFFDNIFRVYPTPLDFFDALESCYAIGALEDVDLRIGKHYDEDDFEFSYLSEGELQLISVIGLMTILKDDDDEVLYLIDEPDTHINPKWQRDFVEMIFSTIENKEPRQIFLSTHSPFVVQAFNDDVNLLLFKKELDIIKIDTKSHTIDNWKIGHVLMSEYFDLPSTRPAELDEFMQKRKEIISKGNITEEDIAELKKCEDDMGFLPTGETISEIDDKIFIHKFAEAKRKERGE